MADQLLGDIRFAIDELNQLEYPTPTRIKMDKDIAIESSKFNHTGR